MMREQLEFMVFVLSSLTVRGQAMWGLAGRIKPIPKYTAGILGLAEAFLSDAVGLAAVNPRHSWAGCSPVCLVGLVCQLAYWF